MQATYNESQREEAEALLAAVEKRRTPSEQKIQARARVIFQEYFKRVCNINDSPLEVEDIFPVAPQIIIKHILNLSYFEPEMIPVGDHADVASGKSMTEIAGLMDRRESKIVIAGKFRPEWKRFTAAHEIGHWLLHPELIHLRERPTSARFGAAHEGGHGSLRPSAIYLRERPVTGHELAYNKRPAVERQADIFGAELLMPARHLVKTFFKRFGGPIDRATLNEESAFWLSPGWKQNTDFHQLSTTKLRDFSHLIARATSFKGRHFNSLSARYGVSQSAMAIQLEDLGLVK